MVSSRRVACANPLDAHDEVVVVVTGTGTGALVVVETGTVVVTVVPVAGRVDVTEVVAAPVDVVDGAVVGGMVGGAVEVGDAGREVSSPEQANATSPSTVAAAMTRIVLMASFSRPSYRAG